MAAAVAIAISADREATADKADKAAMELRVVPADRVVRAATATT